MSSTSIHMNDRKENRIHIYDLEGVEGPILEIYEKAFGSRVTVFLNPSTAEANTLKGLEEAISAYKGEKAIKHALANQNVVEWKPPKLPLKALEQEVSA